MSKEMQTGQLLEWGFERERVDNFHVYKFQDGELQIVWDISQRIGAYEIDGHLSLLSSWQHLEDLMEQATM